MEQEKETVTLPKKRKSRSPSKSDDDATKPKRRQALVPKSIAHCAAEQVGVEYNMMYSFSLSCKNGKTTAEVALVGSGRTDLTDVETKDDDEDFHDINNEEDDNVVDQIANAVESGDDDSENEEKR